MCLNTVMPPVADLTSALRDQIQTARRNSRGLVEKFATIKDRIDADTALANNAYGEQNIFFPNVRVASSPAAHLAAKITCPVNHVTA